MARSQSSDRKQTHFFGQANSLSTAAIRSGTRLSGHSQDICQHMRRCRAHCLECNVSTRTTSLLACRARLTDTWTCVVKKSEARLLHAPGTVCLKGGCPFIACSLLCLKIRCLSHTSAVQRPNSRVLQRLQSCFMRRSRQRSCRCLYLESELVLEQSVQRLGQAAATSC